MSFNVKVCLFQNSQEELGDPPQITCCIVSFLANIRLKLDQIAGMNTTASTFMTSETYKIEKKELGSIKKWAFSAKYLIYQWMDLYETISNSILEEQLFLIYFSKMI